MKCQLKYRWVKLPRACLPQGKGGTGPVGAAGRPGGLPERRGPLLRL